MMSVDFCLTLVENGTNREENVFTITNGDDEEESRYKLVRQAGTLLAPLIKRKGSSWTWRSNNRLRARAQMLRPSVAQHLTCKQQRPSGAPARPTEQEQRDKKTPLKSDIYVAGVVKLQTFFDHCVSCQKTRSLFSNLSLGSGHGIKKIEECFVLGMCSMKQELFLGTSRS